MKNILILVILFFSYTAHAEGNYKKNYIKKLLIENAKNSHYVSPSLALAVAKVESNFNPSALSNKGAVGVMQIMPRTALLEYNVARYKLFNPEINIKLGIDFLDSLIKKYKGNIDIALSHYNGGSAVGKWPNVKVIPVTYPYVIKVLKHSLKFSKTEHKIVHNNLLKLSFAKIRNKNKIKKENKKNITELDFLFNDIDKWLNVYDNYKLRQRKYEISNYISNSKSFSYQGGGTNHHAFH